MCLLLILTGFNLILQHICNGSDCTFPGVCAGLIRDRSVLLHKRVSHLLAIRSILYSAALSITTYVTRASCLDSMPRTEDEDFSAVVIKRGNQFGSNRKCSLNCFMPQNRDCAIRCQSLSIVVKRLKQQVESQRSFGVLMCRGSPSSNLNEKEVDEEMRTITNTLLFIAYSWSV